MDAIKKFLKPEKKKFILPAILVLLLFSVLILDGVFYSQYNSDLKFAADSILETTKLGMYNYSLNGTDKDIERQFISSEEIATAAQRDILPPFIIYSYAASYTLNTFGANFCAAFSSVSSCKDTRLNLVLPVGVLRLISCSISFTKIVDTELYSTSQSADFGVSRRTIDIQKAAAFIYSDRGQNIIEQIDACKISIDTITDKNKLDVALYDFNNPFVPLFWGSPLPEIKILTAVDIIIYLTVVIISSYLLSCLIVFTHRKNKWLYRKGKIVYACIASLTILFIILSVVLYPRYNISDVRLTIFFAFILAYAITSSVWYLHEKTGHYTVIFPFTLATLIWLFFRINYPDGYYDYGEYVYYRGGPDMAFLIISAAFLAAAVITYYLWKIYGKEDKILSDIEKARKRRVFSEMKKRK